MYNARHTLPMYTSFTPGRDVSKAGGERRDKRRRSDKAEEEKLEKAPML